MNTFEILTLILAGISVLLTGVYVLLTLRIANKTGESVKATQDSLVLAREQLEINKQQSKEAAALSEKQSQAAMQAIREQIQASEKQNREQMENQFKPFVVPVSMPESGDGVSYRLDMTNQGAGVALNVWGFFTMRNFPLVHYFEDAYVLNPNYRNAYQLINREIYYPQNEFAGYPIVLSGDESGIKQILRLLVTYNDIFNNKFLVIFDYNEEFGWQLYEFTRVEKRLDEVAMKKRSSNQ
jgi:hypothetical protein